MKTEISLPFRSGFYLTPHSLVTLEGGCMPMFGRSRDKYMYVMTAEPVDGEYLPLDEDIAVMLNQGITEALTDGSVTYYTTEPIPLIPYHIFSEWHKKDYLIFMVRVNDLFCTKKETDTMVSPDTKLHYLDEHFPSRPELPAPPASAEEWAGPGLVADLKMISDSIMMQQKRNQLARGSELTYDVGRATKVMQALKRGK